MSTTTNKLRERRRVHTGNFDKTLTEQNHKERVQIQNILHRFTKTGMLTHVNSLQGTYEDFPTALDFQTMQNIIANAKSMFESIPAQIRAKFKNDPAVFLEAVHDPSMRENLLEMGFSEDHLPPAEGPGPEAAPNDRAPSAEPEPAPEPSE